MTPSGNPDDLAARRVLDVMDFGRTAPRSADPASPDGAYRLLYGARFDEALAAGAGLGATGYGGAVARQIEALCRATAVLPDALTTEGIDLRSVAGAMTVFHVSEAAHVVGRLGSCTELLAEALELGVADRRPRTWIRLALIRALLFGGEIGRAGALLEIADGEATTPYARESARCLRAMVAGLSGDRGAAIAAAERIRRAILTPRSYAHSGIALLGAYGLAASGLPRAAADLLQYGAGGPRLPLLPLALRGYGYDMLVEAALSHGRLELADWMMLGYERLDLAGNAHLDSARDTARARVAIARGDLRTGAERARAVSAAAGESGSGLVGARAALAASVSAADLDDVLASVTSADLRAWLKRALAARGRPGGVPDWRRLTPAQLTVARLAARGLRNQEIADLLVVSLRTVEGHVAAILDALGVASRVGIARAAGADELDSRVLGTLTPRQREVALLLVDGLANTAIADHLGIGVKAVEAHVSALLRGLGVSSRAAAVARLLSVPPVVRAG